MILFFVSECEKKARKRTVQVLDSFAERIGQSTWKARLTMEGLKSLRILLSKKASRHTAVACHRVVGRTNTKLLWIIGNKRKFNHLGCFPTNYTEKDSLKRVENDWHHLETIKVCVALAGLFHDWGKSWDYFQDMLRLKEPQDYIRHEYLSLMLWAAFVRGRKAQEWLPELQNAFHLNQQEIIENVQHMQTDRAVFSFLPDDFSQIIGWLILSHHLQPNPQKHTVSSCPDHASLLSQVDLAWGYTRNLPENYDLQFSRGLPCQSKSWCMQAIKWASRALHQVYSLEDNREAQRILWRPVAHLARTALIIGDHEASHKGEGTSASQKKKQGKQKSKHKASKDGDQLWAKSQSQDQGESPPTSLNEHLLNVTREALSFCHFYPYLESQLAYTQSVEAVERRGIGAYAWQDRAADYIRKRFQEYDWAKPGFFGLNMASTGTGKTFGNAKIMYGMQGNRMRYTLALGLRSLTLQTGDEYRNRMGLDETELAVVVGSKAVRELHESRTEDPSREEEYHETWDFYSDWEEVVTSSPVLDEKLSTKLASHKARQILYSPVLVCTIDHIIGATEETKRGRHSIPWLRMLSSDLVIDEIDDFDGNDLIAIMRLVHLAGMLGRKVMLSSATIPPAVAESAFESYLSGWNLFAKARGREQKILSAWIDEFRGAKAEFLVNVSEFRKKHESFVNSRIKKLDQQQPKRKARVKPVDRGDFERGVVEAAIDMHRKHSQEFSDKKVSFGVIRMANISPCVAMSRYLLGASLPEDVEVRVLTYHSRFPRIIRHNTEVLLDQILKRKNPEKVFDHANIADHLKQIQATNVLFIVVATPVEEVGRDHDFDWAVLEPSSIRSLVQMAGRVMRHRDVKHLRHPNITLLSHNVNALLNQTPAYSRPGYESKEFALSSHNLLDLLDIDSIQNRVDSSLRIARPKDVRWQERLRDLEHHSLDVLLTQGKASDYDAVAGWNSGPWHLANIAQKARPFRGGQQEASFYLLPQEPDYSLKFHQKDPKTGAMLPWNKWVVFEELNTRERKRLWNPVQYVYQLEEIGSDLDLTLDQSARRFGEISVPQEWGNAVDGKVKFHPDLGLWKDKDLGQLFEL